MLSQGWLISRGGLPVSEKRQWRRSEWGRGGGRKWKEERKGRLCWDVKWKTKQTNLTNYKVEWNISENISQLPRALNLTLWTSNDWPVEKWKNDREVCVLFLPILKFIIVLYKYPYFYLSLFFLLGWNDDILYPW